jgi:hypothetical protein
MSIFVLFVPLKCGAMENATDGGRDGGCDGGRDCVVESPNGDDARKPVDEDRDDVSDCTDGQ